jgi:hypothetical protein
LDDLGVQRATSGRFFQDSTLVFIANWWVEHRFRTGADVTVGLPIVVVGPTFRGDFFRSES